MKVPLCTGIEYTNRVVDCVLNVAVYIYSFNLNTYYITNDEVFPNKLIFNNFSYWSLNDTVYYQIEPLNVRYLQSYNYTCPSFNEKCEVQFPNGRESHSYQIMTNGKTEEINSKMQLLFDNGFIYSLTDQISFNLFDGKCFKKNYSRDCTKGATFIDFESVCCNEFFDILIPDKNDEICEEYANKAEFIDAENSTILTFSATHTLSTDGLNVTVDNFTSLYPNTIYKYGTDEYNCHNNDTSISNCFIPFSKKDDVYISYRLKMKFYMMNETRYEVSLGSFIRRNGIYLKYDYTPYTIYEPCWHQVTTPMEPNGTIVKSSLCCTKFRRNEAKTTTESLRDMREDSSLLLLITAALLCACFAIFGFVIWKNGCSKSEPQEIVVVPVREEKSLTVSSNISEAFSDISIDEPNIFIKFDKVLGQGSTCTVYPAKIKNSRIYKNVAIKIPTCYEDSHLDEVMHELSIIHKLERSHPSICSAILWTTHRDIPCLIFEKMETNLLLFVKDYPDESFPAAKILFLQILWQISNALEFIASKNVIHRDVAARNILISSPNIAKLSDFGLWCECNNESLMYFSNFRKKLPYRWLSLEALRDKIFSEKSDVWSFGIVMYEIWSKGKVPYFDKENIELIEFLAEGNRLETPEGMDEDVARIMTSCWLEKVEERPNFMQIKTGISKILKYSRANGYNSLYT